jgi:hypothetical protein
MKRLASHTARLDGGGLSLAAGCEDIGLGGADELRLLRLGLGREDGGLTVGRGERAGLVGLGVGGLAHLRLELLLLQVGICARR